MAHSAIRARSARAPAARATLIGRGHTETLRPLMLPRDELSRVSLADVEVGRHRGTDGVNQATLIVALAG